MSEISFGGLATGIDTESIISELMKLERRPIDRLNTEKAYLNSRLTAFTAFDTKLKGLLSAVKDLDTSAEVRSYTATAGSDAYFTTEASGTAAPGNYQIEVVSLARQQKMVSDADGGGGEVNGYASQTDALALDGSFDIEGDNTATVTFTADDSLVDIRDAINEANTGDTPTGVTATIINDGSDNGYRLVLTGDSPATAYSVTNVSGDDLGFYQTQSAQQASIKVDNITISGNSNTFTEAIPGINLTLLQENTTGETTSLAVDVNTAETENKIQAFVSAYNDILSFISSQADADWSRDSAFRSITSRLQGMLVRSVGGSGNLQYLTDLGISTDYQTGKLSIDSDTLSSAVENDLDSVDKLLAGEDGVDGIAVLYREYLEGITDSSNGILAAREESTESQTDRIDDKIERIEARLETREKALRAQFEALEKLASTLNSQGEFLTQQLSSLNKSR